MSGVTTLPELWHPLMKSPSIRLQRCAICGRYEPLNRHHMVKRSAGELYFQGHALEKPTITLCGFGNHLKDADGRFFCHGLAHANRLHFRWVPTRTDNKGAVFGEALFCGGHLEYLLLDTPTDYLTALSMKGWKRLPKWRRV